MHQDTGEATALPFLHFDRNPAEGTKIVITDQKLREGEVLRIEEAMAALARPSVDGPGRLRVAVVGALPPSRSIFYGQEQVGTGFLADALASATSRPFDRLDIVFLVEDGYLGYRTEPEDTLHIAVHNVASLTAAGAAPRNRDGLYLSACAVILSSLNIGQAERTRLTQDFLRMWLRSKLDRNGDPPEWSMESLTLLKTVDPWAAALMEGFGDALGTLRALALPATLQQITDAARSLQAAAILTKAETAGRA